jgi:uncharacterized protein
MMFRPQRLGPGAVYLRGLDEILRSNGDLIKVAEIEPQTLWTKGTAPGARPRGDPAELYRLSTLPQRTLIHGIGCPLGGTICDQELHVEEFGRWTDGLASPWTSEHLSILDVKGAEGVRCSGFLMPPLQTEPAVELAARNIVVRAKALGTPVAFETGVNYLVPQSFEMTDGEFFAAIADMADCGILLDLANLWVNDRNGRSKIGKVLADLPLERVWEVHLAGIEYAHGHWLDAHSGGVDPELADIAADLVATLPNLGAIIFEIAPDRLSPFGATAFLREMEGMHRLWDGAKRSTTAPMTRAYWTPGTGAAAPPPEAWERLIAERMLPAGHRPTGAGYTSNFGVPNEQGFSLYAQLSASFRRGTIAELLQCSTRLLLIALGEQALRDLLAQYFSVMPPSFFPTDEALGFRSFVDASPVSVPGLKDMLAFESCAIEATANHRTIKVTVAKDIDEMVAEIAAGRLPGPLSDCSPTTLEIGVAPTPFVRKVERRSLN